MPVEAAFQHDRVPVGVPYAELAGRRKQLPLSWSIRSAELDNFGDCGPVGEGVSEMRIRVGPGYRVYFTRRGELLYALLLGGDKTTQSRDIKHAIEMARALDKE